MAHPRTPARLRVGGLGMAAAPWKHAAGEPGARQRGRSAGSNPVACDRKRIELWPMQGPPPRQQNRLLASRGSCGQWNDIGPRGTRSARGDHRQVKSLAPKAWDPSLLVVRGCEATSADKAALQEENLREEMPARSWSPPGTEDKVSPILRQQPVPHTSATMFWSKIAAHGDDPRLGSSQGACSIQHQTRNVYTTHRETDGRKWKVATHVAPGGHHELVLHLCHTAPIGLGNVPRMRALQLGHGSARRLRLFSSSGNKLATSA